jgi:hypothetical protein
VTLRPNQEAYLTTGDWCLPIPIPKAASISPQYAAPTELPVLLVLAAINISLLTELGGFALADS